MTNAKQRLIGAKQRNHSALKHTTHHTVHWEACIPPKSNDWWYTSATRLSLFGTAVNIVFDAAHNCCLPSVHTRTTTCAPQHYQQQADQPLPASSTAGAISTAPAAAGCHTAHTSQQNPSVRIRLCRKAQGTGRRENLATDDITPSQISFLNRCVCTTAGNRVQTSTRMADFTCVQCNAAIPDTQDIRSLLKDQPREQPNHRNVQLNADRSTANPTPTQPTAPIT
jgi:hypothetical protein